MLLFDATGSDGYNGVGNASSYGNAGSLAALLSAGCDLKKNNCIFLAAYGGHTECLQLLLAAGGDVNKCNNDGRSPILIASQFGQSAALSTLLLAGGDVSQLMTSGPNKGASPLWALAFSGRTECLEQLLLKSCDINLCTDDGRSAVYVAAEKGHADCILKLASAGGDVNKCDNDGRSPIYIAASSGHSACISQLLASRADARSVFNGTSALDIARQNNHNDSVRVLEAALA